MFRYGVLVDALRQALARGERPTDEAQAIEALGHKPLLVEGLSTNLKVTSAADLPLAQALLAAAGECA
jgi:2-C-methyl-D-erythritol 4-phosphate cytidylyltransferase